MHGEGIGYAYGYWGKERTPLFIPRIRGVTVIGVIMVVMMAVMVL